MYTDTPEFAEKLAIARKKTWPLRMRLLEIAKEYPEVAVTLAQDVMEVATQMDPDKE